MHYTVQVASWPLITTLLTVPSSDSDSDSCYSFSFSSDSCSCSRPNGQLLTLSATLTSVRRIFESFAILLIFVAPQISSADMFWELQHVNCPLRLSKLLRICVCVGAEQLVPPVVQHVGVMSTLGASASRACWGALKRFLFNVYTLISFFVACASST